VKNEENVFGLNETYVEILRSQWEQDPQSVSKEWQAFFSKVPLKEVGAKSAASIEKAKADEPDFLRRISFSTQMNFF